MFTHSEFRFPAPKLGQRRLEDETAWIERYRQLWAARFDVRDEVIQEWKREERIE